jgi:hypothetical protein
MDHGPPPAARHLPKEPAMSIIAFLSDRPAATAAVVVFGLAAAAVALPAAAAVEPQRIEVTGVRTGAAAAPAAGTALRYDMQDGRAMHVASHGDTLAVRYGSRAERYLQRDASGRFVSGDGRWSLRFEFDADGAPTIAYLTRPAP